MASTATPRLVVAVEFPIEDMGFPSLSALALEVILPCSVRVVRPFEESPGAGAEAATVLIDALWLRSVGSETVLSCSGCIVALPSAELQGVSAPTEVPSLCFVAVKVTLPCSKCSAEPFVELAETSGEGTTVSTDVFLLPSVLLAVIKLRSDRVAADVCVLLSTTILLAVLTVAFA